MNCKDFENTISLYIDDVLDEKEKQSFEEHLHQCEACREEYSNFQILIDTIGEIQEVELPEDFQEQLGQKLRKEKANKSKATSKWKIIGGVAAALFITVVSATMLPNLSSDKSTLESMDFVAMDGEEGPKLQTTSTHDIAYVGDEGHGGARNFENRQLIDESMEEAGTIQLQEESKEVSDVARKIIMRGRVAIEVEDFDNVHRRVIEITEGYNGYIEQSEIYYNFLDQENPNNSLRSANMQLRIPSDDFLDIFHQIKYLGIVVEENTSGDDITRTYMDIENQLENLKIQEERLREILKKAEEVDDLLRIENELNRIRTEINMLTGRLQNFDQLVSMSTIDLRITQVKDKGLHIQSIQEGLWDRAKNNFVVSINNMVRGFEKVFISMFFLLPWLILVTFIGGPIGYYVYKRGWFKR
ncbi:MAG: DUF4349 domain-containing protein [Clostridiaceae bacterium]|nr:DUF4349 domain-containing protein [Clostridiaceae bacterium]